MTEYAVAKVGDVPEGTHIIVEARGREVGIFNVRGSYYALPNNCFHQNGPVCRGNVSGAVTASAETGWQRVWAHDGEIVMCPWHALEFNVTTGQCLAYPNKRLITYPVKVEGDELVLVM
jgi:3-phenylpropionate/trans-cinnamate dioxygenase ferredoxin subunit